MLSFGAGMVNLIKQHIDEVRNALEPRHLLEALGSVRYHLELLTYPLNELQKYFNDQTNSRFNDKDAYIFLSFIRGQIEELRDIAKEIDEDYESTV
jgi:hypothetical protein